MSVERAQGCLLGQLAGDSLGSLVEFQSPEEIRRRYPAGIRHLADGGTWNTIAGQPTDDSEMALMLARTLAGCGTFDPARVRGAYESWLRSDPFDMGGTIWSGLTGSPNHASQANGALMRISPLGIFGANHERRRVGGWAKADAAMTHPNPVCLQANALFAMAVAYAVRVGPSPRELYQCVLAWAGETDASSNLVATIRDASVSPPRDYYHQQGWVLIAFPNALWQLLHASSLEDGVIDTVMRGGDTDTNAAICGALLGAVYGRGAVPPQWSESVLGCRPRPNSPGVYRPRPEVFWPVDALELAAQLVQGGGDTA